MPPTTQIPGSTLLRGMGVFSCFLLLRGTVVLAIHPFEPRPNHVELTRTRQTADVVEASVAVPIPNERAAGPLGHAARWLASLDATPALPIP
jgi:hypothetical protein